MQLVSSADADACFALLTGGGWLAIVRFATTLISLTALEQACRSELRPRPALPINKDQVRFILNAATAQAVFGTPFGNMPRNLPQDAITNTAKLLSHSSGFKFNEHTSFEFRMSALNVFNHPNFSSVDPFLEDVGDNKQGDWIW